MTRRPPMAHAEMCALGWSRVDPKPWRKTNARWRHRAGWRLEHCGHATSIHPWLLFTPRGRMILTGVQAKKPPHFGTAWWNLRDPAEWLQRHLKSGRRLP